MNNYAISTADLAQSLTKSSASLVAAGGNLAEAAALTATANAIIQDADSVGTALKTTSLRLRGTSVKVLDEEGLDSDGAIESTSKLRSQVLATSGVDILTDSGAYKSTYQILLEIAEVWDKITDDKARAGLLELLAGKRNSSVIAALLQNPEQLKDAYEDAQNAAGSALKENEKYLDSIQGKIDQFNNAMQSMWSNTLDSGVVKWFVGLGTEIIKIVDKIGLLNSALLAFGAYKGISHIFNSFKNAGVTLKSVLQYVNSLTVGFKANVAAQVAANGATMASNVANKLFRTELVKTLATQYLTAQSTIALEKAKYALKLAEMGLMNGIATTKDVQAAQAAVEAASIPVDITKIGTTELMGLAFKQLAISVWGATKAIAAFLFTNPVGWLILAIGAIAGGIAIFSAFHKTTAELQEELDDMKSSLADVRSELDAVNQELKTTNERMAELLAKESLTLVEQEELDKLKKTNAELKRKKAMLEAQEKYEKERVGRQAAEVVNSKREEIGWWLNGKSAEEEIYDDIEEYLEVQKKIENIEKQLANKNLSSDKREDLNEELQDLKEDLDEERTDVTEYIDVLTEALSGVAYGDSKESDAALDYYHELLDYWNVKQGVSNANSNEITGEIVDNTSITDSLSKIASLEKAYNSLGDAIKEFKEDGTASSSTLEDLKETFGDTDGFEDLYKVLATGEGDVEAAITNVANAYIGQKGILSDLTEDERKIMIERLKALGVINAEEIIQARQVAQEKLNTTYKQYGIDLSNYATAEEAKLAIAQQAGLDFSKINDENLKDLATKYGVDLSNYATLAEQKIAIAREMAKETAKINKDVALSGLDPNSDNYEAKKQDIVNSYNSAIASIPSNNVFSGISSIVNDYFSKDFDFNFGSKIGIGRDFDEYWGDDPQKKAEDAWDKLVSKYENKLALITNERDLIEAEIDKAEALGRQASTKYYDDLIRSSTEEKNLLIEKKAALEAYLNANKDNVDQDTWTEMNNEIHETALAIKECTINLLEYYDALEEIDSHYFEQTMDDVSRLGEEIEFVQGLLEDEDVADENGNWTAEGVTMLGLYTNEMERAASSAEMYKQKINDVAGSWTDYQELLANATDVNQDGIIDVEDIPTEKLDKLYDTYGYVITSEEEYKEKTDELTDSMRSEIDAYNDAKDGIVEMNEARVDAIKDGVEKEIEAYEDYIDTVKEALDAERDLYDFKKNVKKQTKDIASLERRIAALSGSTNASDIALRRKLEAELYEAKESLSDTYYDHAKDQQQSALDEEAEAFSKSKEKYIEELEKQLEDTETLITNSIMDVLLNADTILAELTGPGGISETYGDILSDQLKQPWIDAADQAATWKRGLEEKMTGSGEYAALIGEGGTITAFANGIATKMEGPWSSAQTAASGYFDFLTAEELGTNFENTITGFGTQISNLVTYWDNVKKAAEAAHAEQERKVTVGGNPNIDSDNGNKGGNGSKDGGSDLTYNANVATLQSLLNEVFGEKLSVDGKYGPSTTAAVKKMQTKIGATSDGKYGETTSRKLESYLKKMAQIAYDNDHFEDADIYKKHHRNVPSAVYAKGTMGTTKDQWALTDEIGDELVLVPGPNGNLSFMRKGTSVVPADITANLVEWGKLNPDMLNIANPTAGINMISNAVNKPEFNISFDALVKAENITEETLPAVRKLVTQELNRFTRELNYALKGKGAR